MNEWQRFFREEAPRYMDNVFVQNTVAEADFIVEELGLTPGQRILDVGCGTGRHTIELARRGYKLTGIDLSDHMLDVARQAAAAARVSEGVELVQGDAATTTLPDRFNAAICICEGAFSLMTPDTDADAHHSGILGNVHAMLEPGGRLLLNALSALRMIREHSDDAVAAGRFDPYTTTETSTHPLADGSTVTIREKGFMPQELRGIVEAVGFRVRHVWGGTAGAWQRQPPKLDEYELMVIAERPSDRRGHAKR